jgi:hypothetical protein
MLSTDVKGAFLNRQIPSRFLVSRRYPLPRIFVNVADKGFSSPAKFPESTVTRFSVNVDSKGVSGTRGVGSSGRSGRRRGRGLERLVGVAGVVGRAEVCCWVERTEQGLRRVGSHRLLTRRD